MQVSVLGAQRRWLTWRWPACFLLWLTPSIAQLAKFVGWPGYLAVIAVAAVGMAVLLAWARAPHAGRGEPPWHLLIGVALCIVFALVFPVATSGLFGPGSDRGDAVDVTAAALLSGRRLYEALTYLGARPTPLPGAVLLGTPFHLLGAAALQNVFWFLLLSALAPRIVGDRRGAAAWLAIFVLGCPGVMLDFATGGDFATNAVYVLIAAWLMTQLRADERWPLRFLACALFAVALASRSIYFVMGPIVTGAMLQTQGLRRAAENAACVVALAALVTLPIWLADPADFPLTVHARLLWVFPASLHAELTIPALAFVIACLALFVRLDRGRIWLLAALSLAPMVAPPFLLMVMGAGVRPGMVAMGSYTIPLALYAGLWLLHPARSPEAPASAQPQQLGLPTAPTS
jgi:hypothetical protein